MSLDNQPILRVKYLDRALHWLNALCFFLVAMSGISFFFPSLDFLGRVLGPGQLARTLHPILGVAVFFLLFCMFFRFVHHNLPRRTDMIWIKNIVPVLLNQHGKDLKIGKYNAGQKFLFWCIMSSICLLLVSGLIVWRQFFAEYFPIPVLRFAILIHSAMALSLMLLVIGHIYMGMWVKGSITGMITGYVSHLWARTHHDLWFEEVVKEEAQKARRKH